MSVDFEAEVARLVAVLRTRDDDPRYATAPVVDSYARISRKASKVVEEKTMVQTWRNLCRIEADGYRLGEVLVDEARSAWKLDGHRPAFVDLVERCKTGESNGVVARFVDRLARQPWDMEQLIRVGENRDYRIVTDADTYRFDRWREVDELRGEVKAARRDSQMKSEKVNAKVGVRLMLGDNRNGRSPFGHRWPGEDIPDERLDVERDAVAAGIRLVLDGGSWGDVARSWNEQGLTTRKGTRWNSLNVRDVLQLPRHAGLLVHRGEVVGTVAVGTGAIVTVEDHEALMRLLAGRSKGRPAGASVSVGEERVESPHFLSNVIRCGSCGRPMVGGMRAGVYEDGSRRRLYRCPPKGCQGVSVDGLAAERWAAEQVIDTLSLPTNVDKISRLSEALSDVERKIGEIEAAIERLDVMVVHPDRQAAHDARVAKWEALLGPLLDERARVRAEASRVVRTPEDRAELHALWVDASSAERRRLARQAIPDGFYCRPVGRGVWLKGRAIDARFTLDRPEPGPAGAEAA